MTAPPTNAVVTQKTLLAPGLAILRVAPDGWELPDYEAGQFAVIGLPTDAPRCEGAEDEHPPAPGDRLLRRAYSIASSPRDRESLEFYVALVPSGSLTPRLFALEPGSRIWLGAKISGRFTLSEAPDNTNLVFVGTGTGLAPFMSMLRAHHVPDAKRNFAVLHGVRHSADLGYRTELETLARQHDNVHYLPIISRPSEQDVGWGGPTGHVQDLWTSGALEAAWQLRPTPSHTHVFLCGSPAMIDDMVALLTPQGFVEQTAEHPGQIHIERYW